MKTKRRIQTHKQTYDIPENRDGFEGTCASGFCMVAEISLNPFANVACGTLTSAIPTGIVTGISTAFHNISIPGSQLFQSMSCY